MITPEDVEEFTAKRFDIDCKWLSGNCYYFALILKERFGGEIYYDPIEGHFFLKTFIGNFDYNGSYTPNSEIKLESIKEKDPLWYNRLLEDCIL